MKKVSRRELASTVVRQLLDGKDQEALVKQLAAYLIEHKMTNQAGMLLDDIAIELEKVTGHTTASIRAAFPLTDESRQKLVEYVKDKTGATSVELSVLEDKSLLAGVVIRTPQHEYDASARHKLNQLARGEV
jgi:F0F1-type ATP synthase delta subunit